MLIVVGILLSAGLLLGDMVTMSELKSDGCNQLCDVSNISSKGSCDQSHTHAFIMATVRTGVNFCSEIFD